MDYLMRDDAPFTPELWQQIDAAVTSAAKDTLVGRRFLPLYGPLGPGASVAKVDAPGRQEVFEDGFAVMQGRQLYQIPQLYEDFWLFWRDMATSERTATPVELAAAREAGQAVARREDTVVFYGSKALGVDGLLTAKGISTQKRSDWSAGEGAFTDVATAVSTLLQKGRIGRHTLIVSMDLYIQLQRIQPNTGVLESERIKNLLGGRLYYSTVLQPKTALMVCPQPQYLDIAVGQDIRTAYIEAVDLNHHLRVLETALVRVKAPDAVVVIK